MELAEGAAHGGVSGRPGRRPKGAPLRRTEGLKRTLDGVGGLGWSVIGFLLGAVFWHFVGFWSFVSEVVLSGGPSAAVEERVPEMRVQLVRTADASAALPACVALELNRSTGVTSALACEPGLLPLAADPFQGREDRMAVPGSAEDWIAPHAPAGALGAGEP